MMKFKNRKKILLTGGTGFVGSSLALVLGKHYRVVCVSRKKPKAKLKKLASKNVSFVQADIAAAKTIEKHMRGTEYVIHLAGGGGNSVCVKDPQWAFDTHVRGTDALVTLAEKHKVKKFIFSSTYHVYGVRKGPVTERASRAPGSFYTTLKAIAEDIIVLSGLNYAIIRFSNVYGYTPVYSIQKAGAIDKFIRACLERKSMRVSGSGSQTIDYVHIQDTVDAVIAVLKQGKARSVYNVGSGETVTIAELAKTVQRIGKKLYKKNTPIKKVRSTASVGVAKLSIRKARAELGWKPNISLEAGITELMLKNKPV